jgi:hypothetical protein
MTPKFRMDLGSRDTDVTALAFLAGHKRVTTTAQYVRGPRSRSPPRPRGSRRHARHGARQGGPDQARAEGWRLVIGTSNWDQRENAPKKKGGCHASLLEPPQNKTW